MNLSKIAKKALTGVVTTTTIMWSVGVASLPMVAKAAVPAAPALIKASGASVYYLSTDGKRYVFPNETTFFTWYKDFSSVKTVTDSELASIQIGGNATFRAGSWMGKITTDPKTYWVSEGGTLHHIQSEADAIKLAGADWAKQVRDIPDHFFVNYKVGAPLSGNLAAEGMLYRTSAGGQVYLFDGGAARPVSSTGLSANGFSDSFVRVRTDLASLSAGAEVTDNAYWLANSPSGSASTGSTTPSANAGSLAVSLASDTPAGVTLADGTSFNSMLKVSLKSSGGPVKISGLKVTRGGITTDSAVSGVSIHNAAGKRLGNIITFADNKATFSFSAGEEIVVDGETSMWVKFNLDSTANSGTVSASIAAATDITSNATSVSGSFPVAGNTFTITDGANSVGSATLDVIQLYTNGAADATASNISIGDLNKDLTKFRFIAGSNEDLKLTSLMLRNNGNALDADWGNIRLVAPDGTVLATAANSKNQYVAFDLATPYTILKGQTRDLTIRMDIPASSKGATRTVRLVAQNDYDVVLMGVSTGASVLPTRNASGTDTAFPIGDYNNGSSVYLNKLTIQSGTLTLSRSSSTPSGNISAGGTGVVLAQWDVTPNGEDMEVRQLGYVVVRSPNTSAENLAGTFRIEINGTTVYSVGGASAAYGASGASVTAVTPNTFYRLPANTKATVKAIGDISSTVGAGTTYAVSLDVTSVRRVQTDDIVDPGVAVATSNTLSVQNASLAVAKSTSYNDTATVAGAQGVKMGSFTLSAGTTEAVVVSSVTVGLNSVTGLSNLVLKSGSTQLGTATANPSTSNSLSFNLEVPGGSTVTVDAYADLQSTATGNYQTTFQVVTATGKASSVTVTANPSTAVSGQTIAVSASGTLTLTLDTTTTPSTHIVHSSQIDEALGAVRVTAGNSEDVKVTNIQFAVSNGTNNYYQFKLFDGATQLGNTVDLVGNVADFGGLNYIVPKSTSKVLTLKATSTYTSIMNIGAQTHVAIAHLESVGNSSGTQIKPGTTLNTTWTAGNAAVNGGTAQTVGSTDGFNVGDVVFVQDTTNGGSLGVVVSIDSSTAMKIGVSTARSSGGTGVISKIASGATTTASAGTVLKAGAAVTVASTVGFQVGDAVLAYNSTDGAMPGVVSAISSGTSMTIKAGKTLSNGVFGTDGGAAASRVSKLGLSNLSTTWTATAIDEIDTTAITVGSSSGFNVGDVVLASDTSNGTTFGVVTSVPSSTTIKISGAGDLALGGTGVIAKVGSTQSSLVSTAGTAGTPAVAANVASTVSSTVGFGVGDVVVFTDNTNDAGAKFGRVGAVASTTSMTLGADVAPSAFASRVTRLPGASSSARLMINHNVEPVITLQATSPSGSLVGAAGQVVAKLAIKADGDRDMTWSSLRIVSNGSNSPQANVSANYELKRGSQSLSKVVTGLLSGMSTSGAWVNVAAGGNVVLCSGATTAAGQIGNVTAAQVAAGLNKVGTKFTASNAGSNRTATVFTITSVTGTFGACGTGTLTVTLDQATTASNPFAASTSNLQLELFDRYFDSAQAGSGDTALQAQVVTAGSTDLLDILADTQNVRSGAGAGTSVSFNIQVPGVAGLGITSQPGGLTWNYTDAAGLASGSLTISDSYPVNSNTLIY